MSLWWTRTAVENKPGLTEPSTRTYENVSRLLANVLISGSLTENDSTDREELPSNRFCRPRLTHSASTELDSWLQKKKQNPRASVPRGVTSLVLISSETEWNRELGISGRLSRSDQTTTRIRREAERYLQTLSHCSAVEDRDHCANGLWKHQGETHKKPLWLFNLIMHEGRPYRNTGSRFNNSLFFFSLLIQSKLGVSLGLIALLWSQAFTSAGPLLDDDGIPSAFS